MLNAFSTAVWAIVHLLLIKNWLLFPDAGLKVGRCPKQRLHYHARRQPIFIHSIDCRLIIFTLCFILLVLKHTLAVNSFRRKWRRRIVFNSSSSVEPIEPTLSGAGEAVPADCTDNKPMDKVDGTAGTSTASQSPSSPQPPQPPPSSSSALDSSHPWRPLGRSSSVATLGHCQRVDLFLAGITHYITYSDQLRDLSLEVHSADGNSLVIQCGHEEICEQWISAIKGTIDRLTDDFVRSLNRCALLKPLADALFANPFVLLSSSSFLSSLSLD